MGYIDAIRGFALCLVVFMHVELNSLALYASLLQSLIQPFYLALFFFISGYLGGKSIWHETTWSGLIRRLQWLIPTLCFGLIYTYFVLNQNLYYFITQLTKSGYWFIIALLEIYALCYFTRRALAKSTRYCDPKSYFLLLLGLAVLLYILRLPLKTCSWLEVIGNITCLPLIGTYFIFFVFGIIATHYSKYFTSIVIKLKWIISAIVLFVALFSIEVKLRTIPHSIIHQLCAEVLEFTCGCLGVFVIFGLFCKYQSVFTSTSKNIFSLQAIGCRTLDIYLLHYFFLPKLPRVGAFLREQHSIFFELIIGITITLCVIGCCLIVSRILRSNAFLSHWLFGTQKPSTS